ncbi:MAG TPA: hypothetical protein VLA92_02110 [Candidatus Saccharimonadales bacterium]|nr:hypothetical protein [Candidatus Saccharimonadales bacterium]
MARLPNPGSDNGLWGDLLNAFLSVEHNADGSLKVRTDGTISSPTVTSIQLNDASAATQRGNIVSISGDVWILSNARWDATAEEFYRIDNTKASFGFQLQGQGYIPGEPDLGYYVAGATIWVAQPQSYALIRGNGSPSGQRFAVAGGWELGSTVTQERQMTIGGGLEIDGYGTSPYGRVINNITGTVLARRLVGMARNAYTALDGYDDSTKASWYWGYAEQYDPGNGNATIAGSPRWTIGYIPPNTSPTSGIFNEYLTVDAAGAVKVSADPTTNLGVATKQYVDARMRGGEAFFVGDGSTTAFFVSHGVGSTPSRAQLTPMNAASVGCWYTKDSTLLGVNFATPPANGATIAVSWTAYP